MGGFYNEREYSGADWLVLLIAAHGVAQVCQNMLCLSIAKVNHNKIAYSHAKKNSVDEKDGSELSE